MVPSTPLIRRALLEKLPSWGVLVLESHHAPDFHMDWRTHSFLKIVYALSGAGDLLIRDKVFSYGTRDVIVVPPRHRNRVVDAPGAGTSLYVLCIAPEVLRFDRPLIRSFEPGRVRRSAQFANQVERRLRGLLFEQSQSSPQTPLAMVAAALEVLTLVSRQPLETSGEGEGTRTVARREMAAYLEHIQSHFFEASTIDDAAAQAGMSRRRFTQLFREATGTSWLDYVQQRRIAHARRLLVESTTPITSIAFECGFQDVSTFYRVFHRVVGCAPGQFRERHRLEEA